MLNAQNRVSGKITDTKNQPIIGVSVSVPELNKGITTDENGTYSFTNLPKGNLKITFGYVGFET